MTQLFLIICFLIMTFLYHRRCNRHEEAERKSAALESGLKALMSLCDQHKDRVEEAEKLLIECYPLVIASGREVLSDKLATFIYTKPGTDDL